MSSARIAVVAMVLSLPAAPVAVAEAGHFHHLHMNVASAERSSAFYSRFLGVAPVQYGERMPAVATERAFLLFNEVGTRPIANHQLTGLTHGSWGSVDGHATYDWLLKQGVEFYTPVEELNPGSTYMYLYGPDREVIEITDATPHHRFNHIHVVADDARATAQWFKAVLDYPGEVVSGPMRNENLVIDGVAFTVFPIGARFTPRENDGTLRPTDGSHIDHIAFSFRDLDAALARVQGLGMKIERPMARDPEYGFRHFFLRAPNGVLVEMLEARAWPHAAWED